MVEEERMALYFFHSIPLLHFFSTSTLHSFVVQINHIKQIHSQKINEINTPNEIYISKCGEVFEQLLLTSIT